MTGSWEVDICFKAGLRAAHTASLIEIGTLDRHRAEAVCFCAERQHSDESSVIVRSACSDALAYALFVSPSLR